MPLSFWPAPMMGNAVFALLIAAPLLQTLVMVPQDLRAARDMAEGLLRQVTVRVTAVKSDSFLWLWHAESRDECQGLLVDVAAPATPLGDWEAYVVTAGHCLERTTAGSGVSRAAAWTRRVEVTFGTGAISSADAAYRSADLGIDLASLRVPLRPDVMHPNSRGSSRGLAGLLQVRASMRALWLEPIPRIGETVLALRYVEGVAGVAWGSAWPAPGPWLRGFDDPWLKLPDVTPGMSGTPVVALDDGAIVGIVASVNSAGLTRVKPPSEIVRVLCPLYQVERRASPPVLKC